MKKQHLPNKDHISQQNGIIEKFLYESGEVTVPELVTIVEGIKNKYPEQWTTATYSIINAKELKQMMKKIERTIALTATCFSVNQKMQLMDELLTLDEVHKESGVNYKQRLEYVISTIKQQKDDLETFFPEMLSEKNGFNFMNS